MTGVSFSNNEIFKENFYFGGQNDQTSSSKIFSKLPGCMIFPLINSYFTTIFAIVCNTPGANSNFTLFAPGSKQHLPNFLILKTIMAIQRAKCMEMRPTVLCTKCMEIRHTLRTKSLKVFSYFLRSISLDEFSYVLRIGSQDEFPEMQNVFLQEHCKFRSLV